MLPDQFSDEKSYLQLFIPHLPDDAYDNFDLFPCVGILSLHFEQYLDLYSGMLNKLAQCVKSYIASVVASSTSSTVDYLSILSEPQYASFPSSSYVKFKDELRAIFVNNSQYGESFFDREFSKLLEGRFAVAAGFAPSYIRFQSQRCPGPKRKKRPRKSTECSNSKCEYEDVYECNALIVFHTFCYKCARVFNVTSNHNSQSNKTAINLSGIEKAAIRGKNRIL